MMRDVTANEGYSQVTAMGPSHGHSHDEYSVRQVSSRESRRLASTRCNPRHTSTRMLLLGMLTAFVFSAGYAGGIEHPRRHSRSHAIPGVKVHVNPTEINMGYGDTVRVKCRAKGGAKVEDMPFIRFYWQLNPFTRIPMNSRFPGVTIKEGIPSKKQNQVSRTVNYISFDRHSYRVLERGRNIFYCIGTKMSSESDFMYFVINKV